MQFFINIIELTKMDDIHNTCYRGTLRLRFYTNTMDIMDSHQTCTHKGVKRLDYEFWKELQDRQLDSDAPKGKSLTGHISEGVNK